MFGRKRGASAPQRSASQNLNAAPSAASAAALAFLQKQQNDSSLSSAAAAAALRSHTTSPVPPSSIQTNRMVRRGSQSSVGSPHGSLRQPFGSSIQRRGSNSSMTERTFRSPSPSGRNAPAVPTIPEDVPPLPTKSHMRNGSQDNGNGGTTASPNVGVARAALQPARISTNVASDGAQGSPVGSPRSSVNFSRPMSPPPPASARMVQQAPPARPASSQGFYPLSVAAQVKQAQRERAALASSGGSIKAPPRPASSVGVPATNAALLAAQTSPSSVQPPAGGRVANSSRVQAIPRPQSPPTNVVSRGAPMSPSFRPTSPVARPTSPLARSTSPTDLSPSTLNIVKRVTSSPVVNTGPPPAKSTGASRTPSSGISGAEAQARASAHLARPISTPLSTESPPPVAQPASSASRRTVSSAAPLSVQTASSKQASRAVSQPLTPGSAASTARTTSVSPSRSARFSTNPYLEPLMHDPLPRAASPAKSAMKGSTSRSRGTSPAVVASSVYSDTSDNVSEDGAAAARKKRGVRVSFDEGSVSMGQAAEMQTPINDISSPQNARARTEEWANGETKMTPRPLLPSFNSVGDRKSPTPERAVSPTLAEQSTLPSLEPAAPSVPQSTSVDESAGAIFATDFAQKREADRILADSQASEKPQSSIEVPSIAVLPSTPRLEEEQKQFTAPAPFAAPEILEGPYVPGEETSRATEPIATTTSTAPTIDVPSVPSLQRMMRQSSIDDGTESDTTAELYEDAEEEPSELDEGAGFASLDAIMESPSAETAPPLPILSEQTPIDATASRTMPGSAGTASDAGPKEEEDWERVKNYWSNLTEQQKVQLETEAAKTREEKQVKTTSTQAPAQKQHQQSRHVKEQSEESLPPWPDRQTRDSMERQPVAMKQSMRTSHQRTGSDSTHMRTSMRDSAPTVGKHHSLRTPMRGENQRPQSAVVNNTASRATSSTKPSTSSGVPASAASTNQAAATALAIAIAKSQAEKKPALQRTKSNDSSASESSFRKNKRRAGSSDAGAGRFSMKKSMRGPSPAPENNARAMSPSQQSVASRLSMRSPSPSMRNSLRGPPAGKGRDSGPTLRGSRPPEAKSSLFGKSSKPKPQKAKPAKAFKSRFADSSDDDDDVPARGGFASRFADSDDSDDEPRQTLRPVRGIPKTGVASGQSTDLDDSDDDRRNSRSGNKPFAGRQPTSPRTSTQMPMTPTKVNANGTAQGQTLHTGTLRPDAAATPTDSPSQPKAKRGFFGLGRKRASTLDVTAGGAPAIPTSPTTAAAASPALEAATVAPTSPAVASANTASTSTAVASQSPATTAQEKPVHMPKTMRGSEPEPSAKSDRGRKLFRRFSSSNAGSPARAPTAADFPYPPPPIPDEYKTSYAGADRPSTSDGTILNKTMRPALGGKRESTMTAPGESTSRLSRPAIYSERTGKKKKGQWLRKMLGVYD